MKQTNAKLASLIFICFFFSCAPKYARHIAEYKQVHITEQPDYGRLEYWAAHPFKKSLSDSLPDALKPGFVKDTSVDVFFLHPTTFTDRNDLRWNAALNDDTLNAKTDYSTILYQASAFNAYRLFAPRYRQAHIRSYYTRDTSSARQAFELAYSDLKMAFQFYLDHYNKGRPIIIASHSQGSTHAQRLLKEFFDGKPLQKQLVAAYVIGMYIPENSFTDIPQCKDSLQTGCFVGWRSFKKGYEADYVMAEHRKCYVTNPLTWTNEPVYAPRSLNLGAVVTRFNKLIRRAADAQIHGNVLWLKKPHFPGSFFFMTKNYHIGDINLFYMNIRENLQTRVAAFRKTH